MREKRTTAPNKRKTKKRTDKERAYRGAGSGRTTKVRERQAGGKTDWYRLRAMTDEEAERNASGDPDNKPAELAWLSAGNLVGATPKEPISLRLDSDVLAWFREAGARYQTRINEVLKAYVRYQKENKASRRA